MERRAPFPRVILIVLDSVGCGELPDAAAYGDQGSDTLGNMARQVPLGVPRLRALGLDRVARIGEAPVGLRGGSAFGGTRPTPRQGGDTDPTPIQGRETDPTPIQGRETDPTGTQRGETGPSAIQGGTRLVQSGDSTGGLPRATAPTPIHTDDVGRVPLSSEVQPREPGDIGRVPRSSEVQPRGPGVADRAALGAYGRMAEASPGKDSVTGHWEMMGVVLDRPFPTFPGGFPADVIQRLEQRIGRGTIGNVVASGTEIIDRLGAEHVRTGKPIVYTSADSVFQIAAHEDVIPIAEQYRICEAAFDLVGKGLGVGRVIARPFVGVPGAFTRTANRHDYALAPPGETLLDLLSKNGVPTVAVGKVKDLFAGRGITRSLPTVSDSDGVDRTLQAMRDTETGLIFANLVDFDTQYGHRNDVTGYAANLERFDERLADVLRELRVTDLLVITADHGNDPTTPSTDHSREHVPLLLTGARVRGAVDLGTRATFADLGQTLAANFGVAALPRGSSFLGDLLVDHP